MLKSFILRAAFVGLGVGAAGTASAQTCPETLDPQANYKCVFINTGAGNSKPVFGDGVTGAFYELGLSGTRATSIYQANLGIGSAVIDTNRTSVLQSYGLNSGTYNNVTGIGPQVNIQDTPAVPGEKNIDSLNNTNDNEGLNVNFPGVKGWNLTFDYIFNGTLTAGGPVFNSGDIRFFHTDIATGIETQVLTVDITGSNLDPANLALFGKITFDFDGDNSILDDCTTALCQDFWNFQTGPANWFDLEGSGVEISFALDTNVNPPFPTLQSLTAGSDPDKGVWARQTTLDSSIRFNQVPEPGSLALVGVALLGLAGATARRSRKS